MNRASLGVVLLVAAILLGCATPEPAEVTEPPAEAMDKPAPAVDRVAAWEEEVAALENEIAALELQMATVLEEVAAAQAAFEAEAMEAAMEAAMEEQMEAEKMAEQMAADKMAAEMMFAFDRLDPNRLSVDRARAWLAGLDLIYVSAIDYDGSTYAALLRYEGGTTATVQQVFGPGGEVIPSSIGLAQTELAFIAPDLLDVSLVELDGQGYSGQLRFTGGNRLELVGIQRVALPAGVAEQVAAAQAAAAAAVMEAKAAQAAADMAIADAEAAADAAVMEAKAAAEAADELPDAAQAEAAAAKAKADLMMAAAGRIDPSLLNLDAAQVSLAGPDSVYVSSIEYDGENYSARLRYDGGTTATVEQVFGPGGELIPDSVGLSDTGLALVEPDLIEVSPVEVNGRGYSGRLRYTGDNRLEVVDIKRVPLPPSVEEQMAAVQADADAAVADARADADAAVADARAMAASEVAGAQAEVDAAIADARAMADAKVAGAQAEAVAAVAEARAGADAAVADARAMADANVADVQAAAVAEVAEAQAAAAAANEKAAMAAAEVEMAAAKAAAAAAEMAMLMQDMKGRPVMMPAALDLSMLDLDAARVSIAGPDSIYLAGIRYAGREFSARLRYIGGNAGVVEAVFDARSGWIPAMDLSAPAVKVAAADTLVISNVGIHGAAYAFSLRIDRDGSIYITREELGHRVRTHAELLRDELLSSADVTRAVRGFAGGEALPDEGAWSTSGMAVSQTDPEASHAKLAFGNVAQLAVATLYGVTGRTAGDTLTGYGLHFLASETPRSGNTWNFGYSYLVWVTQEQGFYDTDMTQVQLYQSLDGNRLMWLNSRNIAPRMDAGLTLEALYNPDDCPETMEPMSCDGSIAVLVDGAEQFKVAVSPEVARWRADTIALRVLGGPVEFSDLYVHMR